MCSVSHTISSIIFDDYKVLYVYFWVPNLAPFRTRRRFPILHTTLYLRLYALKDFLPARVKRTLPLQVTRAENFLRPMTTLAFLRFATVFLRIAVGEDVFTRRFATLDLVLRFTIFYHLRMDSQFFEHPTIPP